MNPLTDQLIVFAKPPVAGRVKTRLTSLLSEEEAAQLYAAFLRDTLDRYKRLGVSVRLYWSRSPEAATSSVSIEEGNISKHVQRGDGLGARMQQAFRETLDAGAERAVIVGTDHPTLPLAFIEQAFGALTSPEAICIGPSEDGGYYLLGMNGFYPRLFTEMSYSHEDVFADTLQRARYTEADLTVLPKWYDVDTPGDLRRLAADLGDSAMIKAPHTRRVLVDFEMQELPK